VYGSDWEEVMTAARECDASMSVHEVLGGDHVSQHDVCEVFLKVPET
jgi:hypothetical protein